MDTMDNKVRLAMIASISHPQYKLYWKMYNNDSMDKNLFFDIFTSTCIEMVMDINTIDDPL